MASPASDGLTPVSTTTLPAPASADRVFHELPIGRMGLPPNVHRSVLQFRAWVRNAVLASHKTVGVAASKKVRTAAVSFGEARRAQWKLHKGGLSEEQEAAWSDRLVRNEERCDKALESLGLDVKEKPVDPWAAIYSQQGSLAAPPAAPEPESQPGGRGETPDASAAG